MKNMKQVSIEEFGRKFDAGESVLEHFTLDNPIRPGKMQRLTLDLPSWTVSALDEEAGRIGITRQSLIKTLIDNGLRAAGRSNAPQL
jgi:hypothetical protein